MAYTTDELLDELKDRDDNGPTNHARKAVWADLEALNRGEWGEVFKTKTGKPELTSGELFTSNLFRTTIEDGGRLFAEQIPSERVDAASDDKAKSEKNEQAIHAYNNLSNFYNYAELFGQDMIAAGISVIRTWPMFSKPLKERFPLHHRVNPLTISLPRNWTMDRPTEDPMLSYIRPIRDIAEEFPEEVAKLLTDYEDKRGKNARIPKTLHIVDRYRSDYICRAAFIEEESHATWLARMNARMTGRQYKPSLESVASIVLMEVDNDTGKCPIQVAARMNWSQIPMGTLDDTRGVARLRNRYWRILLDHWINMVYGPTLVWNVKNPRPDNPIWLALSPDAKATRVGAENASWQAESILERLEKEDRTGKMAPLSREGEVDLNKATAAFLTRAQGQLNSLIKSCQRSFANAKQLANETAMAQDEKWCSSLKKVTGRARGRRFAMTYNPSAFKGDYSNTVDYGPWAGTNQAEWQILGLQKAGKSMSWETFMERDPDIEDVPLEQAKLWRERMRESIFAQLEVETDIVKRFRLLKILDDLIEGNKNLSDIIDDLQGAFVNVPASLPVGTPELGPGEQEQLVAVGTPLGQPGVEQPVILPSREELTRMRR